jgi:acetyl esterase/lipase
MHLLILLLRNPISTLRFLYTWSALSAIVILKRILLPHISQYQSTRVQLQRAYLLSCSSTFPDLTHRLPVGQVSQIRATPIGTTDFVGYIIPGSQSPILDRLTISNSHRTQCVVLYAHGGGYARGEAKMYMSYMERWVQKARESGLNLVFLSVEYRRSILLFTFILYGLCAELS